MHAVLLCTWYSNFLDFNHNESKYAVPVVNYDLNNFVKFSQGNSLQINKLLFSVIDKVNFVEEFGNSIFIKGVNLINC